MTLANKISVLRILTIPVIVILILQNHWDAARVLFILSILTDALDGAVARLRGERTPLGTFLDPLADKLLLTGVFILFTGLGRIPLWMLIITFSRDLLIFIGWGVIYILTNNSAIRPRLLGKLTTFFQMLFLIALLFFLPDPIIQTLKWLVVALAVVSALDYIWEGNKRLGHIQ